MFLARDRGHGCPTEFLSGEHHPILKLFGEQSRSETLCRLLTPDSEEGSQKWLPPLGVKHTPTGRLFFINNELLPVRSFFGLVPQPSPLPTRFPIVDQHHLPRSTFTCILLLPDPRSAPLP